MSVQNTSSQQAAFLHITEAPPQGHSLNMLRSFPNILCAPHTRESEIS